jgi:hypothetical protein
MYLYLICIGLQIDILPSGRYSHAVLVYGVALLALYVKTIHFCIVELYYVS